jgi:hypothetical protein
MSNIADFNKLLIVPSPQLSPAEYLSLVALVESTRLNKPLTHVILTPQQVEKLNTVTPFPKNERIEVKQAISPRKFILSFAKRDNKVKNVQWNQTEKDISLYISMENGSFKPEGMNFTAEGSDYDAVLYYNVANFADVAKVFEPYKNLVNEAKNVSLGKPLGIEHQEVEVIADAKFSTLAEIVFDHIKLPISKANAARLVAAIFAETGRFKKPIKSSSVFHTTAKLIEQGADLNEANAIADKVGQPAPGQQSPANPNSQGGQQPTQSTNQPTAPKPQETNGAPRPTGSQQPQNAQQTEAK